MIRCIISFDNFEELYEALGNGPAQDALDDIRERGLESEFIDYLENLSWSTDPWLIDIEHYIAHELNWIYREMGLYKTSNLDKYPEIKWLYTNLKRYNEDYYEIEDLRDGFAGMMWPNITDIIENFLDDYPKCKEYTTINNAEKTVSLDYELLNLFY